MSGIQNYLHDNHLLRPSRSSSGGSSSASSGGFGGSVVVQADINVDVAEQKLRALASLSVNRPVIRKYIQQAVRKELQAARKRISQDVKSNLGNDPRQAYRAVKYSIYKTVLGGNVSILNRRRAGARYELLKDRKIDQNPKQHGGNRIKRSPRTEKVDSYFGADRGFVLRFVNSGTKPRYTKYGNRGLIAGRRIFEMSALFQMPEAAENISNLIEEILAEEFEKENT